MKCILTLSVLTLTLLYSCNLNKDRKLSPSELQAMARAHADSVAVVLDSLRKVNIYIPPLYDPGVFDATTTASFFELAKATQGELKLLVNSKLITTEIINIINTHTEDNADLLFLIDKTGSMADDIDNVKQGLTQIINAISEYKNVRVAFALYGDINVDGPDWFSFMNLEKNYSGANQFINNITVTAGDDYPESVYEGYFKACDQGFWRSVNKRMILLIGDAPPLEKPLSNYTLEDVISKATEGHITMNFYPIVISPSMELFTGHEATTFERARLITSLYPNPSSGNITVDFVANDTYTMEVYNNWGNLVMLYNISGKQWRKDISFLPNGIYVLRAISEGKRYETIKFMLHKT